MYRSLSLLFVWFKVMSAWELLYTSKYTKVIKTKGQIIKQLNAVRYRFMMCFLQVMSDVFLYSL